MINSYPVNLRNGLTARVQLLPDDMCVLEPLTHRALFALIGQDSESNLHLWGFDGRWREDGSAHPLDIVTPPNIHNSPPCSV